MRGMICRGLRLDLVAGIGLALAIPALAWAADTATGLSTQTTLSAETRDQGGRTHATLTVAVTGVDGLPATGAVAIEDHGKQIAGVALDAQGLAKPVISLAAGDHSLRAVYQGNATHLASRSGLSGVQGMSASTATNYTVAASPAALTLTAGNSGNVTVTVTPSASFISSLGGNPGFITISCSGLPDQASCNPTPETVEILPTTTTATSNMVLVTEATSGMIHPTQYAGSLAWAFLPGALGFAGLAWCGRRRRWLSRVSLIALVGIITMLGTTGCNPRYSYNNRGPVTNPATPAGTYTVTIAAQYNNGVTATTETTTMALTVK